jgi:hypothetical protein
MPFIPHIAQRPTGNGANPVKADISIGNSSGSALYQVLLRCCIVQVGGPVNDMGKDQLRSNHRTSMAYTICYKVHASAAAAQNSIVCLPTLPQFG